MLGTVLIVVGVVSVLVVVILAVHLCVNYHYLSRLVNEDGVEMPSFGPVLGPYDLTLIDRVIFLRYTRFERFLCWLGTKKGKFGMISFALFGKLYVLAWNPEACKQVFVNPDPSIWSQRRSYKWDIFIKTFKNLILDSILVVEGTEWTRQQGALHPIFHSTPNLAALVPCFQSVSQELCANLKNNLGLCELYPWMRNAVLDTLGRCGLGLDFYTTKGEQTIISEAYDVLERGIGQPFWLILHSYLTFLPGAKKFQKARTVFWDCVREKIQHKQKDSDPQHDLLYQMVQELDSGKLTEADVLQNVFLFFLAGHNTTAAILVFVLDLLATHPDVQQKCREEVNSVGEISFDSLKELSYLDHVLLETIRMRPPISTLIREASQDTNVAGFHIPKGTSIVAAIGNLQFDPASWDDPNQFRPERWEKSDHPPPQFIAFGAGYRACLGEMLAKLQMKVILVNLLRTFEFLPNPGHPLKYRQAITLQPKQGFSLNVSLVK